MEDERGYLLFISSISCSLTRIRSNFPNAHWKAKLFLGISLEILPNEIYIGDNLPAKNFDRIVNDNSVIRN